MVKNITCLAVLLVATVSGQSASSEGYMKSASVTQVAGKIQIKAISPRPLSQVLDALLDKYGWLVDYDDPQYTSTKDITEAPGPAGMTKYPSGHAFTVEFPASSLQEDKVLQQVVDSYNESENPGRFEVRKTSDGRFSVVGTAARDDKGSVVKQQVLLDVTVIAPVQELSGTDALNQICEQLSAEAHVQVLIGISPRSLLDHSKIKLGGGKAAARDLISQTLQATHHKLYWRLIYDPSSKAYYMNIHSGRAS